MKTVVTDPPGDPAADTVTPKTDLPVDAVQQQFDAFRYTLSHDLLSPLRTLQEMARILEQEHSQHLPPDASIFLTHFSQGTHKLAERVEALVRYVKVNAQPLDCHRVDVTDLVGPVVKDLRATCGDKATVIVGALPDAHADADLVRQLFTCLLSNAFKFSRHVPEPRIEIGGAESDSGQNRYLVVDNGAGFDMKYAGRLFGLFQRMHGETQFEGTGAGLAIARRIVERHGGSIRAEAVKDQGAQFSFTLPTASTGVCAGA
jgi:light-regulated signal transduction histidine kinase (bacteriophytochrome)